MAIKLKTFTLTLNNTCVGTTYATVYFKLNSGAKFNMSKNITGLGTGVFEKNYYINDTEINTMHVKGDYIGNFLIT